MGVFYINLFAKDEVNMLGLFHHYYLEQYRDISIPIGSYFQYLSEIRILPLMVILVFSVTVLHRWIAGGFVIWIGLSNGVIFSMGMLQMGIKGLILCLIFLIPQLLFYIPAYWVSIYYAWNYPLVKWNSIYSGIAVAGISIGIVLELYVNPSLVKWFIDIL